MLFQLVLKGKKMSGERKLLLNFCLRVCFNPFPLSHTVLGDRGGIQCSIIEEPAGFR